MPAVELPAPASVPSVHAPPAPDATDAARMAQTISQQQATIELTNEQKEELKKMTGKDAEALELSAEELEERIAPSRGPQALF